ncbi:Adenosylmethionine-8-amino-7-oxononanoate aminotransferase [Evansella caseinilytica]|uniref:Adenosylmethionine-8-amino-7-oxononanoate aminotransferase n=1 Tax=Evansella caseinilytica TaxID=1503961 RepID=A0A1H3NLN4_9BACI|nr:aspartate aminotransferase family protein [Evansella caseinilytica]SDY89811.1 Adenosylmethionine-8-amino-7-oxononanoate aminotransferase [Evansella caseinilytica]
MNESCLIKPLLNGRYPSVEYGQGIYLYDSDGKKYIDGSSGAVTAGIGHGVKEIAAVMKEQAEKVSFVYRSQFTNKPAEQLALKLKQWAPGNVNWSFFVNSGSEATETAMKVAIQYWQEKKRPGKTKILSRWMSYHGITIGALSMSGHVERRARFVPLLEDFPTVEPPYCYRCSFNNNFPECHLLCADQLDRAIRRIGSDHIAAFIAEPIIGASGAALVPPPGYYEQIKEICLSHDILFIADEVMTGIGRCGKKFAIDHWQAVPDIIAAGKGMSAGYAPIAATIISDEVMEPIQNGSKLIMSGHTYSANPQSAAIALAVLKYIENHGLISNAAEKGNELLQKLNQLKQNYPLIGDVRGMGMLTGVEFVANRGTKQPFSRVINVTKLIIDKSMEKGLLVYPASSGIEGTAGDAVIIAPPLTVRSEEIAELVTVFEEAVKEVQAELLLRGHLHSDV